MCLLRRKWRMADGGCDDGDSSGGGGRAGADSFDQMDEVSLRLPTVRRGPQQPGLARPGPTHHGTYLGR